MSSALDVWRAVAQQPREDVRQMDVSAEDLKPPRHQSQTSPRNTGCYNKNMEAAERAWGLRRTPITHYPSVRKRTRFTAPLRCPRSFCLYFRFRCGKSRVQTQQVLRLGLSS